LIRNSIEQWLADNTPLTLRTAASRAVVGNFKEILKTNNETKNWAYNKILE